MKTILVPLDFSNSSLRALQFASALARDWQARLLIVHVKDPPVYFAPRRGSHACGESKLLGKVTAEHSHVQCEHQTLIGDPADQIVRVAKQERADLIVMGTHGRTGLSRVLMGSVAEAVMRNAPCPVLTCKQHDHYRGESEKSALGA